MLILRRLISLLVKNESIKAQTIILIDENGSNLGQFALNAALKSFDRSKSDLVVVKPDSAIPVCKIFSKKALVEKKIHEQEKIKSKTKLKEMYIGTSVTPHDLDVKLKKIEEFLQKGFATKIVIEPKGHNALTPKSKESIHKKIIEALAKKATFSSPSCEGSNLIFNANPNK